MSPEQANQIAQAALEAPLNTLVAIMAILAIVVSIVVIGSVIYLAYKFGTPLLKQYQQQLDTNSKLTEIAKQNADQFKTTETALTGITPELIKQTNAIENQTVEIKTQSLDIRNYTTLMNDTVSNHSAQIEANTASITALKETMDTLPEIIVKAVIDELACAKLLGEFQSLRFEVAQILNQQQKRITGTIPSVSTPPIPSEPTPSAT